MLKENSSRKTTNSKYEIYFKERNSLIDAEREGARLFDKAIITLAAGAFGLSLTFIRQLTPNIKPETVVALIIAWIGFCVSLLSTLISFLTSQSACSKQREILEDKFFSNQNDSGPEPVNKLAVLTKNLNIISIITFMIGAVSLAIFSVLNIS